MTSTDIARAAGVSQPTVSRALRGDPRVAAATVERVRQAAERLGYVPHLAARSLATSRTEIAAIVVSDLNNPFYPELVQALHVELGGHGYRALLVASAGDARPDIRGLVGGGVIDGAIIATATIDEETRDLLVTEAVPIVCVVREVPGARRDAVIADNEGGARLAAAALTEAGHRRIAMISGPADTSTAGEREAGFAAGLAAAGLELDPALCRRGPYTHDSGHHHCTELLGLPEPPTAIFCGNDAIALGALDAARRLGVAVPDRLSVIGFDDMAPAAWEAFGLSTVRQPLAAMAAKAAELFVDRVAAPDGPVSRVVFPTSLVRRQTVGPPSRRD